MTDATDHDEIPRTFESGPSTPVHFGDGPGTWAEICVDAPLGRVWSAVTDIDLPSRFSTEFTGATWDDDRRGLGASFVGRNHHPTIGDWEIRCHVDAYDENRRFGWCTDHVDNPGARWRFDLEPTDAGTRLRFSVRLGPGPSGLTMAIDSMPDKEDRIIGRRIRELHTNMQRTVEGIKALAEGAVEET